MIAGELRCFWIEFIDASAIGSKPDHTGGVFNYGDYKVVTDTMRVFRVMLVNFELVAIETVQSILGPEPYKALFVLQDTGDDTLGESLFK